MELLLSTLYLLILVLDVLILGLGTGYSGRTRSGFLPVIFLSALISIIITINISVYFAPLWYAHVCVCYIQLHYTETKEFCEISHGWIEDGCRYMDERMDARTERRLRSSNYVPLSADGCSDFIVQMFFAMGILV